MSHDELWDIDDIDMSFTGKTDKPFAHMKIYNGEGPALQRTQQCTATCKYPIQLIQSQRENAIYSSHGQDTPSDSKVLFLYTKQMFSKEKHHLAGGGDLAHNSNIRL